MSRTYLELYLGFGLIIGVLLLSQAVVLWQVAPVVRIDPGRGRWLIASFFVASMANAVLSWMYIFAVPALFAAVIAVCLGVAFVLSRDSAAKT